jgi:glutathione S-transferase
VIDGHLANHAFLVGERYTLADLAVYGYLHVAGEAGFELADYPAVSAWIERVEATPGHVDDLVPIPPGTRLGVGRSIYG